MEILTLASAAAATAASTDRLPVRSLVVPSLIGQAGVLANGTDTGSNFTIAQIEGAVPSHGLPADSAANPSGFFVDNHSGAFPAGAVRGQITPEVIRSP